MRIPWSPPVTGKLSRLGGRLRTPESPPETGKLSRLGGRLPKSREERRSASASPARVDSELASCSVIANLLPHLGHFIRLPALTDAGMFKTTPHF